MPSWARTARANRRSSYVLAGKADYEVTEGEVLLDGENILGMAAGRARRQGPVPGLPVSDRNSRRRHHDVPAHRAERAAQGARRAGTDDARIHEARARGRGASSTSTRTCCGARSMSASPAARRSATRSCRWRCCEPRLAVLDETDSGLDIDALKIVADGVNRAALAGALLPRHHALSAAARLHRAGRRACAVEGPHRAHRRQGAGARARSAGLRAISGRGGVSLMNAEHPTSHQDARPSRALAERLCRRANGKLPGAARSTSLRESAFQHLRGEGPAASPRRGMEIHRPARADARRQAAGAAAGCGGQSCRRKLPARFSRRRRRAASCSSTACSLPICPILRRWSRACRSARWRRRLSKADAGVAEASRPASPLGDDAGLRAQHRVDGRRRRDPRRRRREHRAAAASRLRHHAGQAGLGLHTLAGQ